MLHRRARASKKCQPMLNLALVCSFSAKGSSHIAISVWLENNQQPFWLEHTAKEPAPYQEDAEELAAEPGDVQKHEHRQNVGFDRNLNKFFKEWGDQAGWGMWADGSAGRNEYRKRGWMNKMVGLLAALHLGHEERIQDLMETLLPCVLYVSK